MLCRGLRSLDELEAVEEQERLAAESVQPAPSLGTGTSVPPDPPFNPSLVKSLVDFNPLDPFWVNIGFSGVATGAVASSSPSFWGGIGVASGTAPADPGS
jgi:hypothetical protein